MEEILLKVMNVTLSFPLCDPGAFVNYPDSQRSGPSLLPTGENLGSKCQTLALLWDPPGTTAAARDHHFLDKEPQLLHARKSRDQGSF